MKTSSNPKTKVLITGGAGFIGSHLSDALIRIGSKVYVIDDLSKGKIENISKQVNFRQINILDPESLKLIKKIQPEAIYHFAAQSSLQKSLENPELDLQTNAISTLLLLETVKDFKKKPKIIFSSSAAVYSQGAKIPIIEKEELKPSNPYAISKLISEELLEVYKRLYNIPYIIFRFSNVYGPRQDASAEGGVVAIFTNQITSGIPLSILNSGEQTRDFIYVGDVVEACKLALQNTKVGTFNISTSKQTSINQLATLLIKISGKKVGRSYKKAKHDEVKKSSLSNIKAADFLKWKPNTSLLNGLKKTFNSFKNT